MLLIKIAAAKKQEPWRFLLNISNNNTSITKLTRIYDYDEARIRVAYFCYR